MIKKFVSLLLLSASLLFTTGCMTQNFDETKEFEHPIGFTFLVSDSDENNFSIKTKFPKSDGDAFAKKKYGAYNEYYYENRYCQTYNNFDNEFNNTEQPVFERVLKLGSLDKTAGQVTCFGLTTTVTERYIANFKKEKKDDIVIYTMTPVRKDTNVHWLEQLWLDIFVFNYNVVINDSSDLYKNFFSKDIYWIANKKAINVEDLLEAAQISVEYRFPNIEFTTKKNTKSIINNLRRKLPSRYRFAIEPYNSQCKVVGLVGEYNYFLKFPT